ncbi:MAG: nickel pincer cofactor biosynthesis protein LarC [Oscillospiraceae bacterium]|nr:nickel pincer cofactor biosynthesis protein LarC [Oscillospiraceae bacterium]
MKILYFDCSMGAAGDMLSAALAELMPDKEQFLRELNALGIPDVRFTLSEAAQSGITGARMGVSVHGEHEHSHHEHEHEHEHGHEHGHEHHSHSSLHSIEHIVSHLAAPAEVRRQVLEVYRLIADAESKVHGTVVEQVHFHEVGALDAVADVAAVCLALHHLTPDKIAASPVHVGAGSVQCAHGLLPVPAPATAELLRGVPIYGGEVQGELCTPTGAALLKYFVSDFGSMPTMSVDKIGLGLGQREFAGRVNGVRAFFGTSAERSAEVVELSCNLDDMTGEQVGFAMERLFDCGALDVWTTPIGMKKSRPAVMLSALCRQADRESVLRCIFANTTTLGVRENLCRRCELERATNERETPCGTARRKTADGWGVTRRKWEYDDLARIAKEQNISLFEAESRLNADWDKQ